MLYLLVLYLLVLYLLVLYWLVLSAHNPAKARNCRLYSVIECFCRCESFDSNGRRSYTGQSYVADLQS